MPGAAECLSQRRGRKKQAGGVKAVHSFSSSLFREEVARARSQRVHGNVVLSQPVSTRILVLLLVAIIASAGVWLTVGQYTRSETAIGSLVTTAPSSKIFALRAGQISELAVREGDIVRAGQRLLSVQLEQGNAGGPGAISVSLDAVAAQSGLAEQQVSLSAQQSSAEQALVAQSRQGLEAQLRQIDDQLSLQGEIVGTSDRSYKQLNGLRASGFVSKAELDRRAQELLVARQSLSRLLQQKESLLADARRLDAETARAAADSQIRLASAKSSAHALAHQEAQLRGQRAYTLAAPIAGRVAALNASVGRTVDASVPLMVIVPEKPTLIAELYAPTRAIGFIKEGQEVRLLYDAFAYQRFGSYPGRVIDVSRVAVDPRGIDPPMKVDEPVYRIRVALAEQSVSAHGQSLRLQPGMTLSASVILDRRSFIDWLLEPLHAALRRNG